MSYWLKVLIAIDQLINTLTFGAPDETISARAYRNDWVTLERLINFLFRDKDHCKNAFFSELERKQLPDEYRDG